MKEITTDKLSTNHLKIGETSGMLDVYDGLKTPITDDIFVLTDDHRKQVEAYAIRSSMAYGDASGQEEPTYVHANLGIPSLVVRIDCTVADTGVIIPYEMEDSPSGQGITDIIHRNVVQRGVKDRILDHYEQQIGTIPHVLVSKHRTHGTDDAIIVGDTHYSFPALRPKNEDALVIVKAIPGKSESYRELFDLQSRAVAPLCTEGDKSYAERSGELSVVVDESNLLRDNEGLLLSQVLKQRVGSMAMGVTIYLSPADRKVLGKHGCATQKKLLENVIIYNQNGGALVQPFVKPIQIENTENRRHTIMRIFVLLGKTASGIRAETIGGSYVARPSLLVHGASDAISGAVIVE